MSEVNFLKKLLSLGLHPAILVSITTVLMLSCPWSCNSKAVSRQTASSTPTWMLDPGRQVTVGHNPKLNDSCDFTLYANFMNEVKDGKKYNELVGATWDEHPNGPTPMDPKDLCMKTDDLGNIDMNQFDCLPNSRSPLPDLGLCGCGIRWSSIDHNYKDSNKGLNSTSHSYEYLGLKELNKLLVIEKDGDKLECVAGRFGHCTLDEYKEKSGWTVTKCAKHYKCRNITVWNPLSKSPIHNNKTGEWWGVCISKDTQDDFKSPFGEGASGKVNGMPIVHLVCLILLWRMEVS